MKSDKVLFYLSFAGLVLTALTLCSAAPGLVQDSVRINRYIDSAIEHSKEMDKARPDLLNAFALAKKSDDDHLIAKVLIAEGRVSQNNNLLKEADSCYEAARSLLKNYPKDKDYLLLLKNLAICNYYLNDNQKVFDYTSEGLKIAVQLNERSLEGTFNNISGIAMDNMGKKAEAMNYYLKALNIFETLNEPEKIASIEINIGVMYEDQHDENNARNYYNKALAIAEKIKDTVTMAAVYNNLGNVFADQKDYHKALSYIKKSLELSEKIHDDYTVALDLSNIGDIYKSLKDSVLEFRYYSEALNLATKIQDKGTITLTLYNLAEYYDQRSKDSLAIQYARKSMQYAQKGGNIRDLLSAMKLLQRLYAHQNNYQKAYQILKSYATIKDSVFSNQKARELMVVEQRNRVNERNHELLLAKETKKRVEAYLIIYILLSVLLVGLLVMWVRRRSLRNTEMQRQKQFVDALLEESQSHVALIDEHFNSTYLSPSLKVFSSNVNGRVGTSVLDFVHPEDISAVRGIGELMQQGKSIHENVLFRLRRNDGVYQTMRGLVKKIEGSHPLLQGYIINFWDVTEIQKSQQALKESEEKLREIFNAFPDIYFKVDLDGKITEISPSVMKVAGFEPEEVIGKNVVDFAQLNVGWEHSRQTFFERNKIQDVNIVVFKKGHKRIDCSLNAHVVANDKGEVVGIEGTLRDITRRIRMDEDLKKSQQKLKIANDSKEKLLSIIAHDLRGAIGTQKAILNMISSDLEDFSKHEIASLINTIKNSTDSTYNIVENLLSWARIMRENIMPRLSTNNLYPVIKDAIDVLAEQAKSKNIALVYEGSKAVTASFDPDLMTIVFRNIISNAIKFSNPESEIKVQVLNDADTLEISVLDTGIGMTREEIKNIFSNTEKLASRPGTNREKGTGLGMIIVREFVAMNRGKLFIESEPGKGTRFIVQFPV